MGLRFWTSCFVAAIATLFGAAGPIIADDGQVMRITVADKRLHEVSSLLFGHFVEYANWHGESGADAGLVDGDRLAPRVVELVASLKPATLRYPGGTLVCGTDWLDFLDNAPVQEHKRWGAPDVQMAYTFDGFLRDCEAWGAEPVLVVNFKKALVGAEPLAECAEHAAALVAYCNLPIDAEAPETLLRWARLRAQNGHPDPYGVKYFQIGNEIWAYSAEVVKKRREGYSAWYAECLDAYITALRAVDPGVVLISDGANTATNNAIRARVGDRLDYMTSHVYGPWDLKEVKRDGRVVDPKTLTDGDVWRAFVSVADIDPETGMSWYPLHFDADTSGYPIAATEWNWNGWWQLPTTDGEEPYRPLDSYWAKGVGAASYLHGLIRGGDRIKLAHQSMLIGKGWGITSVRIPPQGPDHAYLLPTGAITGFYARHHGDRRLAAEFEHVPMFSQPYSMGTLGPKDRIAVVDAVVTADDDYIYVHLISRAFDKDTPIVVDLSGLKVGQRAAVLHVLKGELKAEPVTKVPMEETATELTVVDGEVRLTLPPRVIACLQVARD